MAAYNSRAAENECRFVDASLMIPNQSQRKTSSSSSSPDATKKHLPRLNTTDVDCISVKAKPKPRSKSNRGEHVTAPRYRIQRVENRVAEDLQLSKFLDMARDGDGDGEGDSSEQACEEIDCGKSLSDSFVSVAEPTYDILSDYGSLHEEKSAVGDFEWTLLEDINDNFHATEKDTDLVVLKSAKSYLLALTSNLDLDLGPASASQRQGQRLNKPQVKPAAFKLHTSATASATAKPTNPRGNVKTATLHLQSNIPEEYYIRKSKVHSLHGRALKSRKGVN